MQEAEFVPPGTPTEVAGHPIPDGMVYVGDRLRAADGSAPDPCLLNPDLPVAGGNADIGGRLLGYWPAWHAIKPTSRLAHLKWLAWGRRDRRFDVGYPFLFLYGLERAVLFDRLAEHREPIAAELESLLDAYGWNRSFRTYGRQLLDALRLWAPSEAGDLDEVSALLPALRSPTVLPIAAGWVAAAGGDVPAEVALRIALSGTRGGEKLLEACWEEALALAKPAFGAEVPDRLGLDDLRARAVPEIKGAGAAHTRMRLPGFATAALPVASIQDPALQPFRQLAKRLVRQTRLYLSAITADPDARGSEEALHLLVSGAPKPRRDELVAFLEPWAEDDFPATLGELADGVRHLFGDRVTLKSLAAAERFMGEAGFGVAPSAILGELKKVDRDTAVRVIPVATAPTAPSASYDVGRRLATLAGFLLAGVGDADGAAVTRRMRGILPKLEVDEIRRLAILIDRFLAEPPKPAALRRDIRALPDSARPTAALFAATLAVLLKIDRDDRARERLETVYKTCGLTSERLWTDLHDIGLKLSSGVALARRPASGPVDTRRIEAILADTAEASEILSDIFQEETPPGGEGAEERKEAADPDPGAEGGVGEGARDQVPWTGLDPKLSALLSEISETARLDREAFETAARRHGLMPDGALEAINDWAFDRFDEPVLEEDDGILVRTDLLSA
jgi:hypothetical protein